MPDSGRVKDLFPKVKWMKLAPETRRTASRVVFGLLLAGAVILIMEALGLGGSRNAREIVFSLGTRDAARLVVTYLSEEEVMRVVDLPVERQRARDVTTLPAGRYELELLLRSPSGDAVERRAITLGEQDVLFVDLKE